jgi:hypothetical protein
MVTLYHFVFTVSLLSMTMTRISFPDGFFSSLSCPDKPTNQTHFLHYLNIQDFHKADSCWVVKTLYLHLQNPTLYPHIGPGEYNPQPDIYFYNSELISPPSKHHFPAGKFPHFRNRNVSAIHICSTQATYQHTSLSFAS